MKEAKKSWRRIGKSIKVPDLGQTRRTILGKTGMALVVGLGTVLTSRISSASPSPSDLGNRPEETTPVKPKLSPPTSTEIMQLGECLSYLNNIPAGAIAHDVCGRTQTIMNILDNRDLPATLAVARSTNIRGLCCHYGVGSTKLRDESKLDYRRWVLPLYEALKAELAEFEVRRNTASV